MQKQEGPAGHVRICLLRGWEVQKHGQFLLWVVFVVQLHRMQQITRSGIMEC